jgi:hypothetical protein
MREGPRIYSEAACVARHARCVDGRASMVYGFMARASDGDLVPKRQVGAVFGAVANPEAGEDTAGKVVLGLRWKRRERLRSLLAMILTADAIRRPYSSER